MPRVIVTRPEAEAATWVQALLAEGWPAQALPLITIAEPAEAAVRDHLPEPEWRAIEAWYAHDARKAEAVSYLCDWCAPHWTIESRPARMLVTWRANVTDGSKAARFCSVRDIEGEHGIPKSTAQRQVTKISKVCASLRQHGIAQLEQLFAVGGLIDLQQSGQARAA